jgi:signal transduction histidine kinase
MPTEERHRDEQADEMPHFRVSPSVLGPLGAEQLQDPTLAVLELVKNSWDADATEVTVRVTSDHVQVEDNGAGMARADFLNKWLVIGASDKRNRTHTDGLRPIIGEKGLGRLATFAIGRKVRIESGNSRESFSSTVDWAEVMKAESLETHPIRVRRGLGRAGTTITVEDLRRGWEASDTQLLSEYAQFLSSIPGEKFKITILADGKRLRIKKPLALFERHAEALFRVEVDADGTPNVTECRVGSTKFKKLVFRKMPTAQKDARLAGVKVVLRFLRRSEGTKVLREALRLSQAAKLLDQYHGVRVFRDGINVPPYGIRGDDWAGLERQRTSTGGPTRVPGNSQLIGEVHLSRAHSHYVVTAGRAGFTDQHAVKALARYVRWAAKEVGTARRAHEAKITVGAVPARIDEKSGGLSDEAEKALQVALDAAGKSEAPEAKELARRTRSLVKKFENTEETLRLYAQLASAGIAATSFAHELRKDFDTVTLGLSKFGRATGTVDPKILADVSDAWARVRSFAGLFRVLPVKIRRARNALTEVDIERSVQRILELAPPGRVHTKILARPVKISLVPAELDSIVLNLVTNALKAIDESSRRERGRIRVQFLDGANGFELRVADNGCGVSKAVQKIMFRPLEGRFSEGTGMGLPIVEFLAYQYGGVVALSDDAPPGYRTEFRVRLPDARKEGA